MSRSIYSTLCRESGPASVASCSEAASHRTWTIAATPSASSTALVTSPTTVPPATTSGAPGDRSPGPDVEEDARGVSEVADLRHGLLSEETSLREVDRVLQPRLRGEGVRPEIDAHPRLPAADPPGLEVSGVRFGQPICSETVQEPCGGIPRGHDDVAPRAEDGRGQDDGPGVVLDGGAVEDGHHLRAVTEIGHLHVRREHVRSRGSHPPGRAGPEPGGGGRNRPPRRCGNPRGPARWG